MPEFTHENNRLYYEEHGQGVPVILLHGYPLSHAIWSPVVELLKDQARLITPDLRGFGQSDAPAGTYSMRSYAGEVAALMDHLNLEKAILAGHSMGGYIALEFARNFSNRLQGLIMVCTQAFADSEERRAARLEQAQSVLEKGPEAIADTMPQALTVKPELMPQIRSLILATRPDGIAGALRGMAERSDFTSYLPEIRVPALVIAGEADKGLPPERVRPLADGIPNARYVQLSGAAHTPMLEDPESLAREMKNWLKDNSPAG